MHPQTMPRLRGMGRDGAKENESSWGYSELPPPPVSPPSKSPDPTEPPPGYEPPDIKLAKEFRKETLPQRIPDKNHTTMYRLARPGEKAGPNGEPPRPYRVLLDGCEVMDEFGLGVGLYYRQLIYLGTVVALCCIIYIPTIIHHNSFNDDSVPWILRGTAINAQRDDLSLRYNGIPNLLVTLLLLVFAFTARNLEKRAIEKIDTNQQTPQDYTVCIHNPPDIPASMKPEMYYDKYKKFGEIVFVTICLTNGPLLQTVSRKRVLEHRLQSLLAQQATEEKKDHRVHRTSNQLSRWQACLQKYGLFPTQDFLQRSLQETKSLLEGLSKHTFKVKRVYVTFNEEEAQRDCLKAVETGLLEEKLERCNARNEDSVIGDKVCIIDEAEEPSEVRWENLHYSFWKRSGYFLLSFLLSGGFLTAGFFVLMTIPRSNSLIAAVFISMVNMVLPVVVRTLTIVIERHKSLTDLQASMMFKLVITRMVNSAFLLYLVTPIKEQLTVELMQSVFSILIADAFTTPIFRLTNVWDLFLRTYVAPKVKTQAEMNVFYQGAEWHLAERYTDVIKTLFVGLFYSAIAPSGLIITLTAMATMYWVDKYSLLRLWKRPPAYNASLSSYARKYILLCAWVHLIMARIFFAHWPNTGKHIPDCGPFYCRFSESQPDEEDIWTDDQQEIVQIYELLGLAMFVIGGGVLLLWNLGYYMGRLCKKKHVEVGEATKTAFREVSGIDAYIPLIQVREMVDPLLAIDVKDLPKNARQYLPLRIGGYYNADSLSMNSEWDFSNISKGERDALFGVVKYYPGRGERMQDSSVDGGFVYETGDYMDAYHMPSLRNQFSRRDASFVIPPSGSINAVGAPVRRHADLSVSLAAEISSDEEDVLPEGWEMRETAEGRPYYVSHVTRTSQWNRPNMAMTTRRLGAQAKAPSRNELTLSGGGGMRRTSSTMSLASSIDLHSAIVDLPEGWEVRYNKNNRPYYVNHNNRTTSWDHPRVALAKKRAAAANKLGQGADKSSSSEAPGAQYVECYTTAGIKYFWDPVTNKSTWSLPKTKVHQGQAGGVGASSPEPALPAGWEMRKTNLGKKYFVNHDLRITQWNPPPGITSTAVIENHRSSNPDVLPAPPSGNQRSRTLGRAGEYATATVARPASHPHPASEGQGNVGGLPQHIEMRTNQNGRQYYVNHKTKMTSWVPPTRDQW